jgi:hypothetical protein
VLKLPYILHIPLSKQHHELLFDQLLMMGIKHAVLKHCAIISRDDFERWLDGKQDCINAYVELYSSLQEFRIGKDNVEGQVYLVLAALNGTELILLIILQNPSLCTPSKG